MELGEGVEGAFWELLAGDEGIVEAAGARDENGGEESAGGARVGTEGHGLG